MLGDFQRLDVEPQVEAEHDAEGKRVREEAEVEVHHLTEPAVAQLGKTTSNLPLKRSCDHQQDGTPPSKRAEIVARLSWSAADEMCGKQSMVIDLSVEPQKEESADFVPNTMLAVPSNARDPASPSHDVNNPKVEDTTADATVLDGCVIGDFPAPSAVSSTIAAVSSPGRRKPRSAVRKPKCLPAVPPSPSLTSSPAAFHEQVLHLMSLNSQPYRQGTWEKAPLPRRPYEAIRMYQVAADIPPSDKEACLAKLQTDLPEGWADFAALADRNPFTTESLIRPKSGEHTGLRVDHDFAEQDLWGIDCYTRQCVLDLLGLSTGMEGIESRVHFLERELLPAIQRQGCNGWDMVLALQDVATAAASRGDIVTQQGADVLQRAILLLDAEESGRKGGRRAGASVAGYSSASARSLPRTSFRVHPKGVGIICVNPQGIPRDTFVADYLGELYPPWRWFERQDVLKKHNPNQELPDFYNVCLERPKEDSRGYDIVFVEAARRSSFASRLCHSCDPNCHTIVMSVGGQLTLAVYTSRYVHAGEELCWDYACVTESEKEFRAAICLCGSVRCRGSFLYYANSATFVDVMTRRHTFLDRTACIVRAGAEPLKEEDLELLAEKGFKSSTLMSLGEDGSQALPPWLTKWAALILQYIECEFAELPDAMQQTKLTLEHDEAAVDSARGVRDNRLQNLLITLNKVGHCLRQRGQPQGCPLRLLSEEEVLRYLWVDSDSIKARWLKASPSKWRCSKTKRSGEPLSDAALDNISNITHHTCTTAHEAREQLRRLSRALRHHGAGHAAAADCLLLYAETETWFTPEKYIGFSSPPVSLSDVLLPPSPSAAATKPQSTSRRLTDAKKYASHFIWGQLAAWFKQTIYDPSASLSADRRGTVSLPDPESAYVGGPSMYMQKDRRLLLDHLRRSPDRQWPVSWQWSFKNPRKVYGSPFVDAALALGRGQPSRLPAVLQELQSHQ
eukprot:GGOE01040647.1.p1 GENE.GGOE01040647.1~~GGOE01040647.1.p1  ORF type:complete len:963 (+),score=216.69 GGOE01040647.1:35-2923(+)